MVSLGAVFPAEQVVNKNNNKMQRIPRIINYAIIGIAVVSFNELMTKEL